MFVLRGKNLISYTNIFKYVYPTHSTTLPFTSKKISFVKHWSKLSTLFLQTHSKLWIFYEAFQCYEPFMLDMFKQCKLSALRILCYPSFVARSRRKIYLLRYLPDHDMQKILSYIFISFFSERETTTTQNIHTYIT